jgi:RHS repeat-associated protein
VLPVAAQVKFDYYPFGMAIPNKTFAVTNYRYGFNGKEKDNEVKGNGNSLDYGARSYDPRLGRWYSVDPMRQVYSALSPYAFGANNPLNLMDVDGNILRDKDGNIIATERGDKKEKEDPFSKSTDGTTTLIIKYKEVTIYTDKGNPVQARMITGFVRRTVGEGGKVTEKEVKSVSLPVSDNKKMAATSESVKSNCHGFAFADNNLVLLDGIKNILNDEYVNIGVVNDQKPNANMEAQADIVVIYGTAGVFKKQKKFDESSWNHTGKKNPDGTWSDKDSWTEMRDGLKTTAEVRDSNLEQTPDDDKDRILYKKKEADVKPVESLPAVGKQPSGVRIISPEEIKAIQDGIKKKG